MAPRVRWIGFALLSAASFACMAAFVRLASQTLPQSEVVFFRNFAALLMLMPLLRRHRVSLATAHPGLHLFRVCVGLTAMYLYFHALSHLPLADALLLNYTSPLFIGLFAALWLREPWTRSRQIAAVTGLLGVALLFHPSSAIASPAGLLGLLSGALAGLALTSVKKLSRTEPGLRIVVMFALGGSIISFVPMLWGFVWPSPAAWAWIIGMGLFGNIGHLALTRAYQLAPASQVSPMSYTSLLFAGLIGFIVWHEIPDLAGLAGALVIVTAGIIVAKERSEPAPTPPSGVPVVNAVRPVRRIPRRRRSSS